jgi:hypothetical protein
MQIPQNQSDRTSPASMPDSKVINAILRKDFYSFVRKVFPLVAPGGIRTKLAC